MSILEPDASALAMATFCCSPPEISFGNMPARDSMLTRLRYSVESDSIASSPWSLTLGL